MQVVLKYKVVINDDYKIEREKDVQVPKNRNLYNCTQ